ncbi:hypothetical protein L209DRAFT_751991 [Thermothelomyces heterothallicus CBS 203.75]
MTRPKVPDDKRQRTAQACDSCKRRKQKVRVFVSCLLACFLLSLHCSLLVLQGLQGRGIAALDPENLVFALVSQLSSSLIWGVGCLCTFVIPRSPFCLTFLPQKKREETKKRPSSLYICLPPSPSS